MQVETGARARTFPAVIKMDLENGRMKLSFFPIVALNDDLLSKFDDRINSTDRQLLDCPNNDPDAILRIMFSGRHISVNWTI